MAAEIRPPGSWVLDRRVTIALIISVAFQSAAGLVWAGAAAQRLSQLERRVDAMSDFNERLTRLEEQVIGARAQLERIEANTDRRRRD